MKEPTGNLKEGGCVMTALRRRMIEDMPLRNFSPETIKGYVYYVSQFAKHFNQSPDRLGAEEIRQYQIHLGRERKLSSSTLNLALSALRFFYKVTLGETVGFGAPAVSQATDEASRGAAKQGSDLQPSVPLRVGSSSGFPKNQACLPREPPARKSMKRRRRSRRGFAPCARKVTWSK
jgi:hypothetical protein